MNVSEAMARSDSRHWLAAAVAVAAVVSVFVPKYGWKDALAFSRGALAGRVAAAERKLDSLKSLSEEAVVEMQDKAAAARSELDRLRRDFADLGFAPLAEGQEPVFAAQCEVAQSLARRKVRILSSGSEEEPRPSPKRSPARAEEPFAFTDTAYSATGGFPDFFMFLVAETHRRGSYSLRDICVRRPDGADDMQFTFTLRANRR